MGPYGKSMLYLIRGARDRDNPTEVLGLERSLRADDDLVGLFGLHGTASRGHHVVFAGGLESAAPEAEAEGLASDATTHGGFDNDRMTMNSALRRAIRSTSGEPITQLPPGARSVDWISLDPLDDLDDELAEALRFWLRMGTAQPPVAPPPAAAPDRPLAPEPTVPARRRRRALCIGIDGYTGIAPLSGCVNDAREWTRVLAEMGYDATRMDERDATAAGLLQRIGDFVAEARAGDDFVLQFSGHGTQFADTAGGDESGEGGDGFDEAICAIDCGVGDSGIVLDDQLREAMRRVDPGASRTFFFDSCHSGTVTRARQARQARQALAARGGGSMVRVRRVTPNEAMRAAYRRVARSTRPRADDPMREVVFSACLPNQLAYERDGQGDFTRYTLGVLRDRGSHTNTSFLNAVIRAFGPTPQQTPFLALRPRHARGRDAGRRDLLSGRVMGDEADPARGAADSTEAIAQSRTGGGTATLGQRPHPAGRGRGST